MCICVCSVSQFLVSLLPTSPAVSEKSVTVSTDTSPDVSRASPVGSSNSSDQFDVSGSPAVFRIRLRNVLLHVILRLTASSMSASNSPHGGATINAQSVSCHIVTNAPRVGFGAHVCYHCRISPPRFLAECRKRRLNQGSFVLLFF